MEVVLDREVVDGDGACRGRGADRLTVTSQRDREAGADCSDELVLELRRRSTAAPGSSMVSTARAAMRIVVLTDTNQTPLSSRAVKVPVSLYDRGRQPVFRLRLRPAPRTSWTEPENRPAEERIAVRGCNKKQLGEIAAIADEIELLGWSDLIRQGERGREFFVLLDGDVEVIKDGKPIEERGPGDFFGEIALVSNVPRTATVTTTTPVRMLVVTDRDFKHLLETSPDLQLKVLGVLASRLATHEDNH